MKSNEIKRNTTVLIATDGTNVMKCDMCSQYVKTVFDDHPYVDNGSEITIHGGYGQFMDLMSIELTLCHDCTLEIFRKVPKLQKLVGNGLHSVRSVDISKWSLL